MIQAYLPQCHYQALHDVSLYRTGQAMSINRTPNLLGDGRALMRVRHYSIHTERAYCDWIKRYIRFHGMKSRADLSAGEKHIEAFLTHLAVDAQIAPSTPNQAMNALVFLYKQVLQ
jgi:hypothetical protein